MNHPIRWLTMMFKLYFKIRSPCLDAVHNGLIQITALNALMQNGAVSIYMIIWKMGQFANRYILFAEMIRDSCYTNLRVISIPVHISTNFTSTSIKRYEIISLIPFNDYFAILFRQYKHRHSLQSRIAWTEFYSLAIPSQHLDQAHTALNMWLAFRAIHD